MNQKQLLDMGFQGQAYTWKGRRAEGVLIQERLDRGLINSTWQEEDRKRYLALSNLKLTGLLIQNVEK
ncbi:hypothetical protein Pyn_26544 [Prunus yedoensis var. nudiflora]|uniref:Uncharacterized protein n=1 Tax=Prunus yedoensis var. nudiflora TaxID=2094558 RepID=A0A314UJ72_PRUYE|nr:hypothetical protein Pyn_26544 [Prunus yedoensis var. nudiflora]